MLGRMTGGKEGREQGGLHQGARRVIHLSQASYHSHNVGSPDKEAIKVQLTSLNCGSSDGDLEIIK